MEGYLSLVFHAHLPFVRHPEHDRFLEENWVFEAITETYIPLLQVFEGWHADKLPARIALTLTPTLCAMLRDPLLLLVRDVEPVVARTARTALAKLASGAATGAG